MKVKSCDLAKKILVVIDGTVHQCGCLAHRGERKFGDAECPESAELAKEKDGAK